MSARDAFEVVIGLEVHAQLRTRSKLFSPAPVTYGAEPNHAVHPVCLALPGVLPVLNGEAVALAIRAALATHCAIAPRSIFARKNYFYPDLPKGYQISQYEEPLATGGWIDVQGDTGGNGGARRIRLTRIHMEEDAGKSIHDDAVAGADATLVDLNRAGVPLIEIVSEPDLRSAAEASAYLRTLRSLLRYTGVSDADMEKGHLRCDVNVSLRRRGEETLGTRSELKNLNSFRFIEEAIEAEIERQAEVLAGGGVVQQCTLAYDPSTRRTRVLRLKEDADDYRYFPDPDLIPLLVSAEQIDEARAAIPELAEQRRERYRRDHGLPEDDAEQLTASRGMADFFEAAADAHGKAKSIAHGEAKSIAHGDAKSIAHGEAKSVANWLLRDVAQALNDAGLEIEQSRLTPQALVTLIRLVDEGRTTPKSARELLAELVASGGDPAALVTERGLEAVSDAGVLDRAVADVLAEHPDNVQLYRDGEQKVLNFLMGQVMRKTRGKAEPAAARQALIRALDAGDG